MPPPSTKLDSSQVLQHSFDDATGSLRTTATATVVGGDISVEMSNTEDSVAIGTPTDLFTSTDIGAKVALDVNVANTISATAVPGGLSTNLKTTRVIVSDVPQKVPGSALANRNTLSIRVLGAPTVYFGSSTVTNSTGLNPGYPKFQYEEIFADVKDNSAVEFWAVCDTGLTCEIVIMEIA